MIGFIIIKWMKDLKMSKSVFCRLSGYEPEVIERWIKGLHVPNNTSLINIVDTFAKYDFWNENKKEAAYWLLKELRYYDYKSKRAIK